MARKRQISKDQIQVAKEEYTLAISLMQYHTQLLWSEFGAFFVAETVIIAFLGNAMTSDLPHYTLVLIGSIIGFIICLPWWSTFSHNYEYYILRIAQARQHEMTLGLNLFTQGKSLSEGCIVKIDDVNFQHSLSAKILPPRNAVKLLIILFGLVFVALISFSSLHM